MNKNIIEQWFPETNKQNINTRQNSKPNICRSPEGEILGIY